MSKSAAARFGLTEGFQLKMNPFTDEFLEEEVAFYDLAAPYSKDGVEVKLVHPGGQMDDYLNKNWRLPSDSLRVPILKVDGELWMSLTWMEVQSMFVPIAEAIGVVGTAGLGLGYVALRMAGMPDVEKVHVYERESRVVDFFMERFGKRREMGKIEIHIGDARKEMLWNDRKKGPSFDYVFMDIYQTLLPNKVIDDIALFEDQASFGQYRFWGQEAVMVDSVMSGERPSNWSYLERAYYHAWYNTEDPHEDPHEGFLLSNLYRPLTDESFRKQVYDFLGHGP